jgi:hypothetical protein
VLVLAVLFISLPSGGWTQSVGVRLLLVVRAIGIPGHPAPGNPGVSHRFPGSTTVTVKAIDAATGWLDVEDANGISAWITRTYVAQVLAGGPPPAGLCYPVGTWNLEHFHDGVSRGFPENTQGGPTYPSRSANDPTAIAAAIRDIVRESPDLE